MIAQYKLQPTAFTLTMMSCQMKSPTQESASPSRRVFVVHGSTLTKGQDDDSLPNKRAANLAKVDLNSNSSKEQWLHQNKPHYRKLAV